MEFAIEKDRHEEGLYRISGMPNDFQSFSLPSCSLEELETLCCQLTDFLDAERERLKDAHRAASGREKALRNAGFDPADRIYAVQAERACVIVPTNGRLIGCRLTGPVDVEVEDGAANWIVEHNVLEDRSASIRLPNQPQARRMVFGGEPEQ